MIYESGHYEPSTGVLNKDADIKIYEIKPGLSPATASAVGDTAGPSFHFVLSDTIYKDNRIPPRGFTNAAFEDIQSQPVGYSYADGQYWDETTYTIPGGETPDSVVATLFYQTTSREYIEFLRDENNSSTPNNGTRLYDYWVSNGRGAPVIMAHVTLVPAVTSLPVDVDKPQNEFPENFELSQNHPNPFNTNTQFKVSIPNEKDIGIITINIYDIVGRKVRTLFKGKLEPGTHPFFWDGKNDNGKILSSGTYFYYLKSKSFRQIKKMLLLK